MNCPICANSENWPIDANNDPLVERLHAEAGATRTYSWQLCKTCGNAFPSEQPLPVVLGRYWQINRRVEGSPEAEKAVWQARLAVGRVNANRSYGVFAPLHRSQPGRFLDIACGLGETVAKFRDAGWRAEGIDLDANTRSFHAKRGLDVSIGRFEDEPIANRYEMIHIAHAIYFIIEPMAFLRRLRAQIAEGGLFAVVISDFLAASAAGQKPGYLHSFYPCCSSMCYALTLAGLEPILTRRIGGSIYIAARPGPVAPPRINTKKIYRKYLTADLRYATIGAPYLAARHLAKRVLGRD